MKKSILKILFFIPILGYLVVFVSCRDFLNINDYTEDMLTYDSIFQNKDNLESYLWSAADKLPHEGAIWGNGAAVRKSFAGIACSDEGFIQWISSGWQAGQLIQGTINADNVGGTNLYMWDDMYKIIRKMNLIIANIGQCTELTTVERNLILGYTYFLRAYAYYNVLMAHGPVVLAGDQVYETNMTPDYYVTERATYDESVEYICSEMEKAARFIPATVTVSQFGRPTRGAVYGIISRLRLQHASPLFNGGGGASGVAGNSARSYFGEWKRESDGANYVNQQYDEKRWALAAYTAKRVMDMHLYSLHVIEADNYTPALPAGMANKEDYPNGPGGIDPFKSYSDMFTGEGVAANNPEFVWGRMDPVVKSYTQHSFPKEYGGYGGMALTQKVVDAFYMADGSDPVAPGTADCPYNETGFLTGKRTFSGYVLGGGQYGVYNMYVNREARFYACVGFSQCLWPMLSTTETAKNNVYFGYATDDNVGKYKTAGNAEDYTTTGYVSKKYVHTEDAWSGTSATRLNKPFGIVRYAEILLNYAEALNNLSQTWTITGSDSVSYTFSRDVNEIANAFNLVRYRAGLPGLTAEQLGNKEKLFEAIERERMIEFLHENRRYYDIRRWGVYLERDAEPIEGMNIEGKRGDGSYYQRTRLDNLRARSRVTDRKMVWLPISSSEIKKVPAISQNPGW
ncbi:MAG: RagB/SusD family nutrient uptake outer membrane protein [Mangrovibacterium sp.]